MYEKDILTLKLFIFILVLNRTTDKWPNQEVKSKVVQKVEVLICGGICCITLHFSKKRKKKCAYYNPREVIV